ncbi:MAG TPA: hypothetical protein VK674_06970 [Candidatus Limnocylindria bacterium]|nr:hypothetical protein [Candidatus Limnocylindria bacterium]
MALESGGEQLHLQLAADETWESAQPYPEVPGGIVGRAMTAETAALGANQIRELVTADNSVAYQIAPDQELRLGPGHAGVALAVMLDGRREFGLERLLPTDETDPAVFNRQAADMARNPAAHQGLPARLIVDAESGTVVSREIAYVHGAHEQLLVGIDSANVTTDEADAGYTVTLPQGLVVGQAYQFGRATLGDVVKISDAHVLIGDQPTPHVP